jgi:uncharacterized membrane protein
VVDQVDSSHLNNQDAIEDTLKDLENNYRYVHPVAWWIALIGPFVLTLLILLTIYLSYGPKTLYSYLAASMSAFFVFGRFIILLATDKTPLSAFNLFAMLTYMDTMVAMFVAFHMGIVFRIPFLGPKIAEMVSDGQFILKRQPWIRRAAFIGLVGFVIFPTSTTGSVGGSIFGRILGMKRLRVVLAIIVGSILGNGLMLLFSKQISKYAENDSWVLRIAGVVAMLVALFIFERNVRRLKDKYEKEELESMAAENESSSAEDDVA